MFKLVKILNSKNNCPEFVKFRAEDSDVPLIDGTMVDRQMESVTLCGGVPKFVVVGNYSNAIDKEIVAYAVTEDMIFRTQLIGEHSMLSVGTRVSLASNLGNDIIDSVRVDLNDSCGRIVSIEKQTNDCIIVDVCFDGR